MTKAVYTYDTGSGNTFTGSKLVDDDYQPVAGETLVAPAPGLYEPLHFDGVTFIGTDQATWQAAQDAAYAQMIEDNPEMAPQPSDAEVQLAALALTVATNKTEQDKTNAQLLLATATQVAASSSATTTATTTTDGGNA